MANTSESLIAALRAAAAPLPEVDLVVLFGSRAAGRPRPTSDVDVAVALNTSNTAIRQTVEATLARACPLPLDVVFFNDAPPQLRFEIARSGTPIFSRSDAVWPRERARAMLDWWDWAPHARVLHQRGIARLREETAR